MNIVRLIRNKLVDTPEVELVPMGEVSNPQAAGELEYEVSE